MSESDAPNSTPTDKGTPTPDPRQALRDDLLRENLERKLAELEPPDKGRPSKPLQAIGSGILLILLLALIAWTILTQFGVLSPLFSMGAASRQDGVYLKSVVGQYAIILARKGDEEEAKTDRKPAEKADS